MIDRIKRIANNSKVAYRLIYICYLCYSFCVSILYFLCRVKPIDNKKIVFCNMKGKRYGDNPMYISDVLLNRNNGYDIVWLLDKSVEVDIPVGVRRVDYSFFNVMKELTTAKVWVDSNMKYNGTLKRKGQLYIQTWHGSYGLKKICRDLGDKYPLIDRATTEYNNKIIDVMVSNSKRTTDIYKVAFGFTKNFIEKGSPRNDIFFQNTDVFSKKVFEHFNLSGKHIALYAPTYRSGFKTDSFKLDYERLIKSLETRFGGDWVVLIRLHPNNLDEANEFIKYSEKIINASNYSVMQELLVASDILITDYSSCMFDFATTEKPCFLYATDVSVYKAERDYYFELTDLPFPLAENNDQMDEVIQCFNVEEYNIKLKKLFSEVGLCETGRASEFVADYIEEWIVGN